MKILRIVLRVLLVLLLLIPVLGTAGIFPAPTADLYTPNGWVFMSALMASTYLMPAIGILCTVVIVLTLMNKMALAALLLSPLTVNVIGFHTFTDTGLFTPSATLGILLLLLNAFFLWDNRATYKTLW